MDQRPYTGMMVQPDVRAHSIVVKLSLDDSKSERMGSPKFGTPVI